MDGLRRFVVSVPTALVDALDEKLAQDGESRSAVVRRLLQAALREAEEQEAITRYVQGYRAQPQTDEEFGWSDLATREALATA